MQNTKTFISLILVLPMLFCIPESRAEKVVLATGEWIPYTSSSMEDYGEFTRSVTIVLKEMGVEPVYHFYPWRRCFDAVLKGTVWAAFPYSRTKERGKKVGFSEPLSCSKTVVFYHENGKLPKSFHFGGLEDLKPYKIGGVAGYFYEEAFKKAGLTIDYVNKEINAMEKLSIGRIDVMPVNERVGWNLIHTHFPDSAHLFKTLAKPLNVKPLRLIVSKSYPESEKLLDRFHQALKTCVEKGHIDIQICEQEGDVR